MVGNWLSHLSNFYECRQPLTRWDNIVPGYDSPRQRCHRCNPGWHSINTWRRADAEEQSSIKTWWPFYIDVEIVINSRQQLPKVPFSSIFFKNQNNRFLERILTLLRIVCRTQLKAFGRLIIVSWIFFVSILSDLSIRPCSHYSLNYILLCKLRLQSEALKLQKLFLFWLICVSFFS